MRSKADRRWTKHEEMLACYLSLYGDDVPITTKSVAKYIGRSTDALPMRIGNFNYLRGIGGLGNPAKQTIAVYEEYKDMERAAFRKICLDILGL